MPATRFATTARICAAAFLGFMQTGCGPSNLPQPRKIQVAYDPLLEVRSYLEGYAGGRPVGSEQELFEKLVEEIRKTDAERATVLESGLAEIVKSPATARALAKKLLDRL